MKFTLTQPQRLKAIFVATVLGAAAIEGTVLAQKHHVHTGKDAFLHYQVDSTDELIQALKENPTLRKNYAQHFGIPENQVVDFVKRTLVPYHLPEGRTVTTYGVTKSGHIYPVHTYLKKGTLVWATRSGLPVLKWACANPLTKHLPGTLLSARPLTSPHNVPRHMPKLASVESPELPASLPTIPTADVPAPGLTVPDVSASSALTVPPIMTGSGSAAIPAIASLPIPTAGGGHGSSLLPLIPILVGVATIGHGGGGGSATSGMPTVIVPVPTPGPSGGTSTTPNAPGTGVIAAPTPNAPGTGIIPVATPSPVAPKTTPSPNAPSVVPTPPPGVPVVAPTPAP